MTRRASTFLFTALIVVLLGGTTLLFLRLAGQSRSAPDSSTNTASDVQPATYQGTDLGGIPAPDFTLQDQNGAPVSLASLRGHPVVLTFFDSVCPHADCSLMAGYINATAHDLGAQSNDVRWVALSLNPWHDTPASATAFLTSRQVTVPMHYLLGTQAQLAPLWNAYHMQSELQSNGIVIHTTGVYLIDAQGHERTFLDEGFDPRVAASQIRLLLTNAGTASGTSGTSNSAGEVLQTQTVNGATIALTATPGTFGSYTYTVSVLDTSGAPVQNAQVTMDLTMPTMAMSPLHVTLGPTNPPVPGAYRATGVLSMTGAWTAVVHVQIPSIAQPVSATFNFVAKY